MKAWVTITFDGDRDTFAREAVDHLAAAVASKSAGRAAVDVRLGQRELEVFGPGLMAEQEERAVITLWDTNTDAALGLALPDGSRRVGAYRVEEIIQRDYEQLWPSETQSPGFKMIAFLHRRPDLSPEAFRAHWRQNHGPLALAHQPGFWRYVQNHVVAPLTDDSPDFDGFGEIHYRTVDDALTRSYDSEAGRRLIRADVSRFLDYERSPTLTTNEWLVAGN